jgi:hypothetical protein
VGNDKPWGERAGVRASLPPQTSTANKCVNARPHPESLSPRRGKRAGPRSYCQAPPVSAHSGARMNALYYGDNLGVLRGRMANEKPKARI